MSEEPSLQPTEQPVAPSGPSGFVRFIVVLLLLVAIGGFGCVTLCGAAFTIGGLGGGGRELDMLSIALPSLLIGGALTWLCVRTLLRYLGKRKQ
ncbi:hypothetical protein [Ideonella sp. YS5]|uniref:hypothetical protein n=1 Tax=Ideonella sp. YS5 TaxID=3453714 RepID=UPI003EEEE237